MIEMSTVPSIYIPRVHHTVTWQEMKAVFEELLGEGSIKRVDIVKIKPREGSKPPPFNRAYVIINEWPESHHPARDKLVAGGSIDLYPHENSDPYWLCVLNKVKDEKKKGAPKMVLEDRGEVGPATLAEHAPQLSTLGLQMVTD